MIRLAKVCPLYSSSKGNATFIGNGDSGILVDAGVNCKRLAFGLNQVGLTPESVKGIFITHDHTDHISGLNVFTKHYDIPVYAQKRTLEKLFSLGVINSSRAFEVSDKTVEIDELGMQISAFDTPHDTEQSCGYKIHTYDNKNIAVCTDLGYVTQEVEDGVNGCDLVLLEANYDLDMLKNGSYPYTLKQRIMSNFGHLCNSDSARFIKQLLQNGTTRVILGHLSQENNTPQVAENTVLRELYGFERNKDYLLSVAPVSTNGMVVTL